MGRYTFTASVPTQAGQLNSAVYNPPVDQIAGASNLSTNGAHMDAGVFLQIVLKNAREKLLYANPAWIQPMPLSGGHKPMATYFKWSEINFANGDPLEKDPNVFKLAEGVTPSHNLKMTVTTESITTEQYGLVTYYSDIIGATSFINFKTQLVERLGWGLGRIIDAITKLHYKNNLSLEPLTAEGAGAITWKKLVRLRTKLNNLNVTPPQSEGDNYPMIVHPNQLADMLMDTNIKTALDYSAKLFNEMGRMHPACIGEAAGFKFYSTTGCLTWDGSQTNAATAGDGTPDGYENIVIGRDLLASTSLNAPGVGGQFNLGTVYGMGGGALGSADAGPGSYNAGNNATWPVQMIEKGFGSGGATGDPLDQVASLGFKATFGLKIIQPTHGCKVRFTSAYM